MARESNIEWTDATFNPWIGCARVSPACDHCYAAVSRPAQALGVEWGANTPHRPTPARPAFRGRPMTWHVGTCDRCGEPGHPWAACVFRVRILRRFLFWRWRAWAMLCDECCGDVERARRARIHRRRQQAVRRPISGPKP